MNSHDERGSNSLGPEFNKFLFESIGLDQFGRPLSVVSALARLDLDAWAEAATLARLPHDLAAEKLSACIRKFTECPQAVRDSHKIAVQLIALLPGRPVLAIPRLAGRLPYPAADKFLRSPVLLVSVLALLVGLELLLAPHPAPSGAASHVTHAVRH